MTSELRVDRIIPVNGVASVVTNLRGDAGGGVIQIRQSNTFSLNFASAETPSTAWVATGIKGYITPTRNDSKIFILATPNVMMYENNSNQSHGSIKVTRKIGSGSVQDTNVVSQVGNYDYGGSGVMTYGNYCLTGFDSPNTTEQIEYEFYVKRLSGEGIRLGYQLSADQGSNSYITMMEIAG